MKKSIIAAIIAATMAFTANAETPELDACSEAAMMDVVGDATSSHEMALMIMAGAMVFAEAFMECERKYGDPKPEASYAIAASLMPMLLIAEANEMLAEDNIKLDKPYREMSKEELADLKIEVGQ